MSGPQLDGRRARALEAEMLRRAEAVLSGDGGNRQAGPIARAIFGVAARIGEEVTRRLDQAPAKQADNFYTAAGIGRDPARAATLPVALKLVEGATEVLSAPAGLQLMTDSGGPVFFETGTRIDLAPGAIAALRGVDAVADSITIPSGSVMAAALPRAEPLARRLRGGAAAGATKLQIDPAAGLKPGMLLRVGEGEGARHYDAVAVEGDLVTIEPPLETGLAQDAPVLEVGDFAPFEPVARNRQAHFLYVGHASLLDVPSAVTITISGADLPEGTIWSWWGKLGEDDPPAWHALTPVDGSGLRFAKEAGKPAKTNVRGRETLWLRAALTGKSAASSRARDLRIAIGGGAACDLAHTDRCARSDDMMVGFEAVANTAPVVTNQPFHPFGPEPRLFDSFYIGSDEAFSKAGAEVSLCFKLAGAELGPLAAITEIDATRLFAAGTDGLLYRAQLIPAVVGGTAELRPLPPPSNAKGTVFFQSQSPVALWKTGNAKRVAVAAADRESLYVAELLDGTPLSATTWMRLPFGFRLGADVDDLAVHGGASSAVLYARVGADLYRWSIVADGALPAEHPSPVHHLTQIEPSDPLDPDYPDAVLFVENSAGSHVLVRRGAGAKISGPLGAAALPSTMLRAFVDPADAAKLFLAGYDPQGTQWELQLTEVDAAGPTFSVEPKTGTSLLVDKPAPVAFSPGRALSTGPPPPFPKRPMLTVATTNPAYVTWYKAGANTIQPTVSWDPTTIGVSTNPHRGFARSIRYTAVQQAGVGLLFRASPGGAIADDIRIPLPTVTRVYLVDTSNIPTGAAAYAYFANAGLGATAAGFPMTMVGSPTGSGKHVLQLVNTSGPFPVAADDIVAYGPSATSGNTGVGTIATEVKMPGTGPGPELVATVASGIWHFVRTNTNADDWPDPASLRTPSKPFVKLTEIGRQSGWDEAVLLPASSMAVPGAEVWRAENADLSGIDMLPLGAQSVVLYPHAKLYDNEALFLAAPRPWQVVGPDLAANPTLSWEYWNGESWWALKAPGAGPDPLTDQTDNLVQTGGVFFKVPADLKPTEVVGRKSHWLRVRLVSGGYGEAKVTVTTKAVNSTTSEQIVNRDLSTIRAPYVTSLKLGYCVLDLVLPEIVLTDDSLGAIDQTSANQAGLDFRVFMPVGELMNPVNAAEKAAAAAADAERCDDPCPPPPDADNSPCDAPGAYDSCDSPCIAEEGYRRPAGGEASGFVRGLMMGFARGFAGDTVSLYVDAEPGGVPTELAADMLRDGRFVPVAVVKDTSFGLTEPGILTLALPVAPDRSDLLGAPAHWLRLRPKTDAANWSPRLNAIHLNAVLARSVETRVMERLGASTGLEGQIFRLSEAPVEPDSLVLRVRETLADEDDPEGKLDVKPLSLPGQWVRWAVSDDLIEGAEAQRAFLLDAEQGIIRFGDGKAGRIPPLGADILAETYARVIGRRANGVPPGKQLQLLAPLAGVERATALDFAAGGSDAEALDSARRRAPAKVRHGRRILTQADLEDHALTLEPGVAQVRAEGKGGGMRLVVALKGAEARPSPAALRGFAAAIREVSGYGLARPGGLIVVGPRLLPIAIELVLQPRSPDSFAEAAEQAKQLLVALFDPATGNHDGQGWPLGRVPDGQDIAAALTPIEALALPVQVTLRRADRDVAAERKLPGEIPSDVLIRLDPNAIAFERSQEAAA